MGLAANEIALEREAKAWELLVNRGYSHEQIGQELGLPRTTVTSALKRAASRYEERVMRNVGAYKAQQIASLQFIYSEAMAAWERSKEPSKMASRTTGRRPTGRGGWSDAFVNESQSSRDSDGDTKYFDVAMRALGDMRKILGLDAPTQVAFSGGTGMSDADMSEEDLQDEIAQLEKVTSMQRELLGQLPPPPPKPAKGTQEIIDDDDPDADGAVDWDIKAEFHPSPDEEDCDAYGVPASWSASARNCATTSSHAALWAIFWRPLSR